MAAIDFPNAPTLNQIFTSGVQNWQWDGTAWNLVVSTVVGATGATGPQGAPSSVTGPTGARGSFSISAVTPPASPPANVQVNRYQRGRVMVCSSTYGQPTDEDQEPDLYRPRPAKNSSSHARTLGTSINPIDLTEPEDERVASCACGNDCTIFYSCTACYEFECEMIFTFTDRCMYCRVNKR